VDGLVNLAARLGVFLSWLIGVFDNKVVTAPSTGLQRDDRERFRPAPAADREALSLRVRAGGGRSSSS